MIRTIDVHVRCKSKLYICLRLRKYLIDFAIAQEKLEGNI